jgi:hypothetical protein
MVWRMELRADARLAFPRPVVFAAYRDKITDMLPYLPNVRRIEVKERKEAGDLVTLHNVWHGGGEIPAAARAFLSEAMLSWDDTAEWKQSDFTCHWVITTHAFTEAVKCEGWNRFYPDPKAADGEGTLLEIRGTLEIDARKVKGVPGFLAGKVGKAVEEFLTGKIQPNLVEVTHGLRQYLEANAQK